MFSKTFGYALRGMLYIALMQDEKRYVQVEEIAGKLTVPRHFMGKILKKLAQRGLLVSAKGPAGGFKLNNEALTTSLIQVVDITDGLAAFKSCVLSVKECNSLNPCPMHHQMVAVKTQLQDFLSNTTIGDLLTDNKTDFIKSISTGLNSTDRHNISKIIY